MKANKYDMILKMFVGNDDLRPAMMNVNNNDGFLEATNAHIAIRMPEKLAAATYLTVEKYPDLVKVYPKDFKGGTYKVNIDSFSELLASAHVSCCLEDSDCEKCAGIGTVECPCCNNDAECKECDGSGTSESTHPFAKLEWHGQDVLIEGRKYAFKYLHTLWMTALIHDVSELVFNFPELDVNTPKATVVNIGEINCLIMPIRQ